MITLKTYLLVSCAVGACLPIQPMDASIPHPSASGHIAAVQKHGQHTLRTVYEAFWRHDVLNYDLDRDTQTHIDNIDSQEMQNYFAGKGVDVRDASFLSSSNLITWLKFKKQGSAAIYAWLELTRGGKASFVTDVARWQTIEKERRREFVPTYLLLMNRTLESKMDRQVWADIFRDAYLRLGKDSRERRSLLLIALSLKIWTLDDLRRPTVEHFDFLGAELKREANVESGHQGMLAFMVYAANMVSKRYDEAAPLAEGLHPQSSALYFEFLAHILGSNIEAARQALAKMPDYSSDAERIEGYRKVVDECERLIQKQESNKPGGR